MPYYDIVQVHVGSFAKLGFDKAYKIEDVKNRTWHAKNALEIGNAARKPFVFFLDSYEVDLAAIKEVARGGGAFVIASSFFTATPSVPPYLLAQRIGMAQRFVKACLHNKARVLVCSMAKEEHMCLSAHELVLFGQALGIPQQVAKKSLELAKVYFEQPNGEQA